MNKRFGAFDINYNKSLLTHDLIAGFTLFVMLIPQSMAYALLAGLPPVMGLYASTIPLIIYAFFASSKHLSIGPVAITSLLVFSGVSVYAPPGTSEYVSMVILLALMVGAIQLLLGVCRGGMIVKFIPQSVLNGYTSAAAIVIGVSQLKHILGINIENNLQVHLLLYDVVMHLQEIHLLTFSLGIFSMISLIILRKLNSRLPNALIVVIISITMTMTLRLDQYGLNIIGDIPKGFPEIAMPVFSLSLVQILFPMAFIISLLSFMESLAISKAVARIEHYKIDPNKEFRALGVANMVGAFFQSFPVNGSFSRTAVNHQAGGQTQMATVVTAVCVMITLHFFTSLFYYLPNAVLGAIIIVAVIKLIDIKALKYLFNVKPLEGWIWLITFFVTLLVGIQWGIMIGACFTVILLLTRSVKPNIAQLGYVKNEDTFRDIKWYPDAITSEKVLIIRIDSSLHFANISFLEDHVKKRFLTHPKLKYLLIDMSGVNDVDTVSIEKIEEIILFLQEKEVVVLFANMKGAIRDTINKVGWDRKYPGQQNHLTVVQLLNEKGIRFYFQQQNTSSHKKDWVNDYSI